MKSVQPKADCKTESKRTGWVYFILNHDEWVVKIGFATNVWQRLADLQTGNHHQLSLSCTIPAHRDAERLILQRFKEYRVRGEWFHMVSEMEDFWDDVFNYQGSRLCNGDTTPGSGKLFVRRMDTEPVALDELTFLLNNIGGKWPLDFPRSVPLHGDSQEAPEPTEFDKEPIRL